MMRSGWTTHDDKLRLMESLCCKLEDVVSSRTQHDLCEVLHAVRDDLVCLQEKWQQIVERLASRGAERLSTNSNLQLPAAGEDNIIDTNKRFVVMPHSWGIKR